MVSSNSGINVLMMFVKSVELNCLIFVGEVRYKNVDIVVAYVIDVAFVFFGICG